MQTNMTAAILAITFAGVAAAQNSQPLQPLDETVEDVDPLAESLRMFPVDLRSPTGFADVYAVPGQEDKLMRVNGGLYAVFPQSAYAATRFGPAALIPADTIFYIGTPRGIPYSPARADGELARIDARVSTSINSHIDESRHARIEQPARRMQIYETHASARSPVSESTVVNDAAHRQRRINELMQQAAASAKANTAAGR